MLTLQLLFLQAGSGLDQTNLFYGRGRTSGVGVGSRRVREEGKKRKYIDLITGLFTQILWETKLLQDSDLSDNLCSLSSCPFLSDFDVVSHIFGSREPYPF